LKQLYNTLLVIFSTFWILFVFGDYFQKHPLYYYAVTNFKYFALAGFYLLFTLSLCFFLDANWRKKIIGQRKTQNLTERFSNGKFKWINWLTIFTTIFLLMGISIVAYIVQVNNINLLLNETKLIHNFSIGNILFFMRRVLTVSLATFFVMLTCRVLGNWFCDLLGLNLKNTAALVVEVAIGIMLVTTLLFVLGLIVMLKWFAVASIFSIILVLRWKKTLHFLKALIRPITIPQNLNWIGVIGISALLIITAINYNQLLRPIPTGYDALTLYVNLPSLIGTHGSLVQGYQPHNWSLFMSLGYVLFNMTEVALCLSSLGGIFTLFAMYYVGKWLNININYLLLGLAAFYLTPSIVHQSSKELKVDLGLLFIQLSIIITFIHWYFSIHRSNNESIETSVTNPSFGFLQKLHHIKLFSYVRQSHIKYLIVMGMLTGYSVGIKITSYFVALALLAGIWLIKKGKFGYMAIFFFSFSLSLFIRADAISGLRNYHLSAELVKYVCLVLSLILLTIAFLKERELFTQKIRSSIIYGSVALLSFLPWLGKSYLETNSTDIMVLINGKQIGPVITAESLDRNWKKVKDNK